MRELEAYSRSTPTFLFSVTDYMESGVDFTRLKACMVVKYTDNETEYKFIVMPSQSTIFNYEGYGISISPSYSRKFGDNTFAITIPLWRYPIPVDTVCEYQVFLYSDEMVSDSIQAERLGVNQDVQPAIIMYHNILIDEGTLLIKSSLLPGMADHGNIPRKNGPQNSLPPEMIVPKARVEII